MVEVTEDDKEIAAELAHALGMTAEEFTSVACDVLVQIAARHRQAGVQQGLDMAAGAGRAGIYQLTDEGFVVGCCEFRESHADDMAGAVAAAIRKLGGGDA